MCACVVGDVRNTCACTCTCTCMCVVGVREGGKRGREGKGSDPSIIKLGSHGDLLRCGVRDRYVTRHLLIFGEGS